ncbi:hypothetical protein H181DRAFT_04175 [Streptomyces sp. WMMB 714]|uniref:hypothetical protein n=1 Tax=Streptomyces sp. WMMB 714 TaxID=1286822 RepID=UPI0005F8088D|nr:hypothetical protein [Streptomyces sp. WMMB 714]SCK46768.1 hypothetical protein H181DRAFT_04175 [Streptomyces sp. WMMB 714]
MSTTPTPPDRTDDELAALDPAAMLRYGLSFTGAHRTALFGDGAVCAAVRLDRLGVQPRAVAFVAKIVRGGGVRYAADLTEPVPGEEAAAQVRSWLRSASDVAGGPDAEETCARWLEAVAELLALRRTYGKR